MIVVIVIVFLLIIVFWCFLIIYNKLTLAIFVSCDWCMLSYPNFIRGALFDDMQPLLDRFEELDTHCKQSMKFRDMSGVERKHYCAIRKVL